MLVSSSTPSETVTPTDGEDEPRFPRPWASSPEFARPRPIAAIASPFHNIGDFALSTLHLPRSRDASTCKGRAHGLRAVTRRDVRARERGRRSRHHDRRGHGERFRGERGFQISPRSAKPAMCSAARKASAMIVIVG